MTEEIWKIKIKTEIQENEEVTPKSRPHYTPRVYSGFKFKFKFRFKFNWLSIGSEEVLY